MKKLLSGLLLLLCSQSCFAINGDGVCVNRDSGIHMLNLTFGPLTVAAANNHAGYNIFEALTNTTATYPVRCHCDDTHGGPNQQTAFYPIFYTGDPAPGLVLDRNFNGLNYYVLNDYLSVGVEVFIINNQYAAIPFEHLSNQSTNPQHTCGAGDNGSTVNLDSGRSAKLSFYVRHSITGTVTIPTTEVAWLYAGMSDHFPKTTPVSKVTINGQLTAPQNCELTPNQIIDVDFQKINSSEFSPTAGTIISGRKIKTEVKVSCTGMQDVRTTETVSASMVAADRSADATMIATSNPDVGIKIFDKNDRPVSVDGGNLPADMSSIDRTGKTDGSVTFYSAPASLTGTKPAPDNGFTATATLIIEFTN
ncbi:fimbrial protein [Salmonella enterica subsp. enterica serovar Portland]|uniref:fimbrial protein n=1 Tax=Salmonella enterica TaxID=28901 RepID=UPI00126CEF71|nr:fimbrial protein [Salmonella enterica]EBX6018194.1 fimbrial protein [Salmonella enterica subsp. enterica serovar Dortmund]ECA8972701.1 fimbrial protein [Salmonella enterica subsp. enterica serovar Omuna]ECE0505026.1 fimbrial protein [Salmonella enterica subsp. enterica]EDH5632892.1 fimbrial protein [Salmonella enterica subsp. enterica serovar Claibornei]EDS6040899.1 fimbrial protein [Salmonella enterica subsp. enterica serovar Lexington]EEB9698179.1 fimbrial protein [Salmonella enterica su